MSCPSLKRHLPWLLLLLLLAACSRPVPVRQPISQVNANAILQLAQNLEQKQLYRDSHQAYENARNLYRSYGDFEGQCYALSGMARIAFIQADEPEYERLRAEIVYLVQKAEPTLAYMLKLLDIYHALALQDYEAVLLHAKDEYDYPLSIRIQMLSHHLQAESYLKPGYDCPEYRHLKRLSDRYRSALKRDFAAHATVLATAEYAMAYHTYLLENYKVADKHINRAIDLDYRYEILDGLAAAYWLKGAIQEKLQEPRAALTAYLKARDIFTNYPNANKLADLDKAIQRLENK